MAVEPAQALAFTRPAAQDRQSIRAVFQSVNPESCPHHYNFHMHTVCSDGQLQPEDLIQQAVTIGLKGLAITDHHSVRGYHRAQRWLDHVLQTEEYTPAKIPILWTGVEINACLLDVDVHILCYGFDPEHPAIQPYLQGASVSGTPYQADVLIRSAHAAGGLTVLAHPARYRRSPEELIPEAAHLGIDGVETYYAYDNPTRWRPSPDQTRIIHQLGETHHLLHTCGTDTHGHNLLRRL